MDKKSMETIVYAAGVIAIGSAAANILYTVTKPVVTAIKKKINSKKEEAE